MRAAVRWVRAEVRARPGQAVLALLGSAGVVAALFLAAALLEGATDPWRGLFLRSAGAHIWVHVEQGTDPAAVRRLGDVTGLAGPYTTTATTLVRGPEKTPLQLRAMDSPDVPTARPLTYEGRWIRPGMSGEIVLERSLAEETGRRPGDRVKVIDLTGETHALIVVGIAETSDQGFYPAWTPGLAWVSEAGLNRIEPDPGRTELALGLRLADGDAAEFTAQRVVTALGGDTVQRVSTWRDVQAAMVLDDRLLGALLALAGIVGLAAAMLAITNATGGRILMQSEDIGTLKSLGFTPGQVTGMLVAQHLVLGGAGIALGLLAGALTLSTMSAVPPSTGWTLGIAAGSAAAVLFAAILPAWRAGRRSAVPAPHAAPAGERLSRLAGLALTARLPQPLVLGAREVLTRRLSTVLTIGGLAIPMLVITIGLACLATLDGFGGSSPRLTVTPGGLPAEEAARRIASDPDVAKVYPGTELTALVPGQTQTVVARGLGTAVLPYPILVAEGRSPRLPGEAVAGQGFLDLARVTVGQRVRITIGGSPVIVRIVGRTIEPVNGGQVISFGMDTLSPFGVEEPEFFAVTPAPGSDPRTVRSRLVDATAGRADVRLADDPAEQHAGIRLAVGGLIVVLGLIALANLVTASSIGLRGHRRDVSVLKAVGLTPRQVTTALATSTALPALIAVTLGMAAGALISTPLIDLQGRVSGMGPGIGRAPDVALSLVTWLIAVAVSFGAAVLLARRASRAQVSAALRL